MVEAKVCYFISSIFMCSLFDHTAEKLDRIVPCFILKQNSGFETLSTTFLEWKGDCEFVNICLIH